MKIVTWNCAGALRNKVEELSGLDADIYVVQECEDPVHSTNSYRQWASRYLWKGDNKNKGIGVFAKNGIKIEELRWDSSFSLPRTPPGWEGVRWRTDELKEFLPFSVEGKFNVVASWTKGSTGDTFGYAGQLWRYLQTHYEDIRKDECMILGDLNSNVRWDRADRWWNHSDNVRIMESIGLKSLYHEAYGVEHGDEAHATFHMYRQLERKYHIDYIFASEGLRQLYEFITHDPENWIAFSDHVPLEVNLLEK